jgi:thiamine-phosphate pyrophosphorylase
MKPLAECRLYAFVDTTYLRGRSPQELARQLCEGGADLIQLRAKNASPEAVLRMATEILPITRANGVGLVINDHLQVAQKIGAEFCHLGQEDFFGAGHRHIADLDGAASLPRIGLSSHAAEQAKRAVSAGAHYLGVGPVYPTGTKPEATPVTLEYVRWASENVKIPWFAIGGITLSNLDNVLAAGARGVCVVSAILCSPNPAEACRQFKTRLSYGA